MGTNGKESLIVLDGVTKVFVTDEVETHALSGIQLDLKKGEYLSIAGPSGCGKSTLLAILGLLDTPSDGTYTLNSRAGQRAEALRTRAHPKPRDRLHLPGVQPDRRSDGV
jgi:putative ABC transport system ATP-binding protein